MDTDGASFESYRVIKVLLKYLRNNLISIVRIKNLIHLRNCNKFRRCIRDWYMLSIAFALTLHYIYIPFERYVSHWFVIRVMWECIQYMLSYVHLPHYIYNNLFIASRYYEWILVTVPVKVITKNVSNYECIITSFVSICFSVVARHG